MTQYSPNQNRSKDSTGGSDPLKPGVENVRQYVRIYYPQDCPAEYLPVLIIRYRTYQVVDISETGVRFLVKNMNNIKDDILTGVIKFTDESTIEISGVVIRRLKNEIAMKLIIGIPYSYILSEQIRLRKLAEEGTIKYIEK